MLTTRIIPCLDVKDGRVVKGVRFGDLRDIGDPSALAAEYQEMGADEIVLLDVSATLAGRRSCLDVVSRCRARLSIPLSVGGGVRTLEDATALLDHGADRVSINSGAVANPGLIDRLARRFGSQCVVVAIDARRTAGSRWAVLARAGSADSGLDAIEWAARAASLGAGEILLTSWDRDGTRSGYDLDLIGAVAGVVSIPVIASGGASTVAHLADAIHAGAGAVLAASIFHDGEITVAEVKNGLTALGLEVRT